MYCFLPFGFINVIIFVNNPSGSYSTFVGADLEYPISLSFDRCTWPELGYFDFEPSLRLWCHRAQDFHNPLSDNITKWSNTLKQFVCMPTNCLSVFDHFVGLALKGLSFEISKVRASACVTIFTIMYKMNYC